MQVCEHIVLPNLGITDDLIELFEMNWVEYIRRDTEGSDHDTRRRAATDLVRSLTAKFPAEVRPDTLCLCSSAATCSTSTPGCKALQSLELLQLPVPPSACAGPSQQHAQVFTSCEASCSESATRDP